MKQQKTYGELLTDPRWQKKRLEILKRDHWTCQECGDKKSTLHVHHIYYEENKMPWEYKNNSLITLCGSCHKNETEYINVLSYELAKIMKKKFKLIYIILKLIKGFEKIPEIENQEYSYADILCNFLINKKNWKVIERISYE